MQKSTVYFADFRSSDSENLQQKFARLLKTAGLAKLGLDGKYVAVKTHFGEPGCLAYLRPNWAKTLADSIRNAGGLPFLTDANTLYVGRRKNALDHISAAYGFCGETFFGVTMRMSSRCASYVPGAKRRSARTMMRTIVLPV